MWQPRWFGSTVMALHPACFQGLWFGSTVMALHPAAAKGCGLAAL
jgi:hypothetical protein